MKRLWLIAAALLCLWLFAACGETRDGKEAFLEDFDYMIQAMEDTFPYFGVAERRLGIDIRQLAAETRDIIENYPYSLHHRAIAAGLAIEDMPELDVDVFWSILRQEFFDHFSPLGNAQVLSFGDYNMLHNFYVIPALRVATPYPLMTAMLFTAPDTISFYTSQSELFFSTSQQNPALSQFLFGQDLPLPLRSDEAPPVYTVEILEEGRIGYMHISTFLVDNFRAHSAMMDRFFRDVQDFDHMIIDIRDTGMGRVDFWRMLVMHVVWPDRDYMPDAPFYTFFRDTEHAHELADMHRDTETQAARFMPTTDYLLSADSIVTAGDFPHLNTDDMQGLGYGLRVNTSLAYLHSNQFHFAQEQMMIPRAQIPFGGQVWLLTSEDNIQASAMFARQAKDMGFATLVGETTGGGYTSTSMTHFALPNSNILVRWDIDYITDQYGRALNEFPTEPHYFNLPGMDALETALAMINGDGHTAMEHVVEEHLPEDHTLEHFLEDIDYMVYVLENNFALLDVASWAHGADYRELAENARQSVLAMEEPCRDTFLAIVGFHFSPLFGTGHFNIISYNTFFGMQQNAFYGGYTGEKWLMNLELFRSPMADRFYSDMRQSRRDIATAELDRLAEIHGTPFNRFWVEDRFSQPVTTETIEEGRIAYISSGRSMEELRQAQLRVSQFYQQIEGYEHLIIDMRGNAGGNVDHFINFLLRPVLQEPIEAPNAFLFFMDGPYVRRFGDILFQPTIYNGFMTITEPYRPVGEILAEHDLPEIRIDDIQRLHYGAPAGYHTTILPRLDMTFDGKVWLLTDRTMGSAAQMAAWFAQEAGHITLVGDITGGCLGGPRTMAFMPNTGIIFYFDILYITDSQGRPLEAGTIPHYFNREGMDALETVLAMIDEI